MCALPSMDRDAKQAQVARLGIGTGKHCSVSRAPLCCTVPMVPCPDAPHLPSEVSADSDERAWKPPAKAPPEFLSLAQWPSLLPSCIFVQRWNSSGWQLHAQPRGFTCRVSLFLIL